MKKMTDKQKQALSFYSGKGVSLQRLCSEYEIKYHSAYSHISRNNLSYKGLGIHWTEEMLERLCNEFPIRFNKELAKDLKVSWRTMVRKARELGIEKEEGFLDKNRKEITEMAVANNHYTYVPPSKNFLKHSFKKGQTNPHIKKALASRMKTIKAERARIAMGLPRETNMNLK